MSWAVFLKFMNTLFYKNILSAAEAKYSYFILRFAPEKRS